MKNQKNLDSIKDEKVTIDMVIAKKVFYSYFIHILFILDRQLSIEGFTDQEKEYDETCEI